MTHDQLKTIIDRYTPTMLDVVAAAPPADIAQLESVAGPLPPSYREFLEWMGGKCPFLAAEQLAYAPADLLEVYHDPEDSVPTGFLLIGVDASGNGFDLHIRREDGAVLRLSQDYEPGVFEYHLLENVSLASYLVTAYVRKTLVPSHPHHFAAGFLGNDAQIKAARQEVAEMCARGSISHLIETPDSRFYGGDDYVLGMYERPASSTLHLMFGAVDRHRYEIWYDLVFGGWKLTRLPT